jgi:hypothetical protein
VRIVTQQAACRAEHLQALGRDPLQGGRDHEGLDAFARLFQERGVPAASQVAEDVAAWRVQEGLVPSG